MSFTKLPNDIIRHVLSFNNFKDNTFGLGRLDKKCNRLINSSLCYFNKWIEYFWEYNSRNMTISTLFEDSEQIPIDPLVKVIDGKSYCIYIGADYEDKIVDSFYLDEPARVETFQILKKRYGNVWGVMSGIITAPSKKHLLFQKELVELWYKIEGIDMFSEGACRVLVQQFEFVEVINSKSDEFITFINAHKFGIAVFKLIISSKIVREKIKNIEGIINKDPEIFLYDRASEFLSKIYHANNRLLI